MNHDLQVFLARRNALFRNLTLEAATAHWHEQGFPPPVDPLVPLGAAHKARLQWLDATDAMLAESVKWLEDNGYETTSKGAPPLTPKQRDADRATLGKPPLTGM